MEKYEQLILRWICLFDDFKEIKYSSLKDLVCSASFQEFADNVFCFKRSTPAMAEEQKLYNTIKGNYQEFEVEKYEDLYNAENSVYICVIVLLHALLKCSDNKFRDQLSEKMDNEEQVLLAKYLSATQSSLFTKNNIGEALLLISDVKSSSDVSEIYSNASTPIKSKSMRRSYLQEFCESPKSRSLICQEKEKLIAKLNEEYKIECEENYKLAENVKALQDFNTQLSNKLEDKDKIIQYLKDEIEEFLKPKESTNTTKVDNDLIIKKLNQDLQDLKISNHELKQQLKELENKNNDLGGKFEKKTSDYENLFSTFYNIEAENISLKENLDLFKNLLQKKDTEITSLKDELYNKSIPNGPMNSSAKEINVPSNTLFDELSCLKLEEVTHDKEKYRHKYKSVKKDLVNVENHVKDLDEQIVTLKQQFRDCETYKDKLINKLTDKKKELQECEKKNNNFEIKIKHLKDSIKTKDSHIESMCTKLDKKEKQMKELSLEMDSVKKAKTMIELILSRTNTEVEVLHDEHKKDVNNLQATIDDYIKSEEQSHKNITDLENNNKKIRDDLTNKENIIIFYEEKMAEDYQTINIQEEQLKTMYEEKLILESHLKNMKLEIEAQEQKHINKNREMENCLEYHLDELKDSKNNVLKIEEILQCKQNEIDSQNKLINYQKNIIETLQSDKCIKEISINNLNCTLEQKSAENINLKEKVQEFTLNLNTLTEKFNGALNEKIMLEKNINMNEVQIKTLNDEFQRQIYDMKILLDDRNNKISQFEVNINMLNEDLEKKHNDFTDQLIICNNQIETISHLRLEKYELTEKLKLRSQDLLDKENEVKLLEDKYVQNELKIKNLTEQVNLKLSENNILVNNLNMITSALKNIEGDFYEHFKNINLKLQFYLIKISSQADNLKKIEKYLLVKENELKSQIELSNKQKEHILILETDKHDLFEKSKFLELCLLNKDTQIISLEEQLKSCNVTVNDLNERLGVMGLEKVMIETNLNETTEQFKDLQVKFTDQINNMSNQLNKCEEEIIQSKKQSLEIEDKLEKKQKELDEQYKLTLEQYEIVNNMKLEKEILEKQILNTNKDYITAQDELKSLDKQLDEFKYSLSKLEKELDFVNIEKTSLETKFNDITIKNEVINQKYIKEINELKNCLKACKDENDNLKNDLNQKNIQFDHINQENNKFKETVYLTENQCIDLTGQLKELNDCIFKKEEDIKLLEMQNAEYSTSNHNLKQQVIEIKQVLNDKHVELENQIQWCNEQRETIVKLNDDKATFCDKIENLEQILSHKDCQFNLCEGKLYDCSNTTNNLEQKLKQIKNEKSSLDLQLNETITQLSNSIETVALLTSERNNLNNETTTLNSKLLNKDNVIASNNVKLLEYEEQNNKIETEKVALEIELNKTINKLEITRHDFETKLEDLHVRNNCLESELGKSIAQLDAFKYDQTQQLEIAQNKLQEAQEQIIKLQVDLHEQTKCSNEQVKIINTLTFEKCSLVDEINTLGKRLIENESVLDQLNNCDKQYKEVELKNTSLMLELNQLKGLLSNLRQESTEQFVELNKKLCEANEQLSHKQSEIKKQIELKNDSLTDMYQKINYLKNMKNELELVIKKEKTDFEMCLETSLLGCINNKPSYDHNQDSLMEVITSADTFIEQNGIQLALVENYNEYTIIEKLKKLFETLKMFIININIQGNEQAIIHSNNKYVSNEKYEELLVSSNIQLETIQHLETEMSKLKAECNYKMSKVQQKTQEYVTSEYEKKFERKREQMKQFCKDLETKIHQDYEAKLLKYKEKINKDELHIKELGLQLWDVSDKYLRLQQKERRESTMSLPYELSTISQTTTNTVKYNSFTLPKSSSASQIRSLVEESNRSYQDSFKRNVPAGIGKKFTLSSGKIFPKEEDEEGEMFNHSCLADLKQGRVRLNDNSSKQYTERLSELQARNSLCPPHLRSSYTVETSYLPNASLITEEDIKTLADFSDCESENLIPNDRNKKKDRNQTSYKKPGPPTPSKNGGRVSLSGNAKVALKEPKESNTNKRRTSSTPNKLFSLFMGKKQ